MTRLDPRALGLAMCLVLTASCISQKSRERALRDELGLSTVAAERLPAHFVDRVCLLGAWPRRDSEARDVALLRVTSGREAGAALDCTLDIVSSRDGALIWSGDVPAPPELCPRGWIVEGWGDSGACAALLLQGKALVALRLRGDIVVREPLLAHDVEIVATLPDEDGDGAREIVVNEVRMGSNRAVVVLSRHRLVNAERLARLGSGALCVGDVDGDAVADFLPNASPEGAAFGEFVSGADGASLGRVDGVLARQLLVPDAVGLGTEVDVDGDGRREFWLTWRGGVALEGGANVKLCSGSTGTVLASWSADRECLEGLVGPVRVGDLDHDGLDEVAVAYARTGVGGVVLTQPRLLILCGRTLTPLQNSCAPSGAYPGQLLRVDVDLEGAERLWLSTHALGTLSSLDAIAGRAGGGWLFEWNCRTQQWTAIEPDRGTRRRAR